MNYRHAFHAGNFADVVKHVILSRILLHLGRKPAPFRVVDTHAGAGRYSLAGSEAARSGEWQGGIGRLIGSGAAPLPSDIQHLMSPYLDIVRRANSDGGFSVYPGSPMIAAAMLRPDDHLVVNELQPDEHAALASAMAGDRRVTTLSIDGYAAVRATLPPKERRGLVLIDPPFEKPGELDRLVGAIKDGVKRFATGTFMIWYPIKDLRSAERLHVALAATGIAKLLAIDLTVRHPVRNGRVLAGAGQVILNPPFTLAGEMEAILPVLATRFAVAPGASASVKAITS
ncbi:MAG TPA: 23S rRNA (adenine(2030)-N(6))-methyltransferase RlmJ [Hyphomicrobiaceae bacterium]|nr:23S rRNA (adenine(2030)-N(6))-methyltransferase RlmJ [Hyphomicrobiaceae bacterium]